MEEKKIIFEEVFEPHVELLNITPNPDLTIAKAALVSRHKEGIHSPNFETNENILIWAKKIFPTFIKEGHLSLFEHASASFYIEGISRVLSHQLVRHRLASYTQQSQRFVDVTKGKFRYIVPPSIKSNPEAYEIYKKVIEQSIYGYKELLELKVGLRTEDPRFVLPNATETKIVITANLREYRHIFELRGSTEAQWEIRMLVIKMYKILSKEAPLTFNDFMIIKEGDTEFLIRKKE